MPLIQRLKPGQIYSIVFILVVTLLYGQQFLLWTSQLPGSSEDAIKNFFTLAYHIEHSSHLWWFTGMNYPYGEHCVYTDNQPLVAMVLKVFNFILPISEALPWMLPLMLITGFWFGGRLLFIMFQSKWNMPWLTALLAVGIMMLSPQWQRMAGHYSLAYAFVIPMVAFGLWKTEKGEWPLKHVLWTVFLAGFIHPYLLVMCWILLLLHLLIRTLTTRNADSSRRRFLPLAMALLPPLLFQTVIWLTDSVTDRPTTPFGFLNYVAGFRSMFFPLKEVMPDSLNKVVDMFGDQSAEGSFYLGITGIAGLLGGVIQFFKALKNKRRPSYATVLLMAAIPAALLAAGWPFSIWKFHHLLEYAGPLKQFRGIGRFAWVLFYAANIAAVLLLLQSSLKQRTKTLATLAMIALLIGESVLYRNYIISVSSAGPESFSRSNYDIPTSEKYTALLPLPYYHIGSENFRTPIHYDILTASMDLAYETGLPLLAVHMSRTSITQTVKNLQLVKHIMELPEIAAKHAGEHWLLMVDTLIPLPPAQQILIRQANLVHEAGRFRFYDFPVDAFADILNENAEQAGYLNHLALALTKPDANYRDHGYIYHENGNMQASGIDAMQVHVNRADWTPLIPVGTALPPDEVHELSFRIYAGMQNSMNSQLWFWQKNAAGEDVEFNVSEIGDHVLGFNGLWALCTIRLQSVDVGNTFDIMLHRDGEYIPIFLDNILLRPVQMNLYDPDTYNINNRYYEPSPTFGVDASNSIEP